MNPELEALLENYDAARNSSGQEVQRQRALLTSRLQDLSDRTGASLETLREILRRKYPAWLKAQKKTATLPPKA